MKQYRVIGHFFYAPGYTGVAHMAAKNQRKETEASVVNRYRISFLTVCLPAAFFLFLVGAGVEAGSYLESAHGDRIAGVNRKSMSVERGHGYARGNCAHCHEQHGSLMGEEPNPSGGPDVRLGFDKLYLEQGSGLCLSCHRNPNEAKQINILFQYSYSYKFGGDSRLSCPRNIRESFMFIDDSGVSISRCESRTGSAHQLSDLRTFLSGKWGFGHDEARINPCSGCHNPHRAQRHHYPVGLPGTSPLSLPSTYDQGWGVFGAKPQERMDQYGYQPPYFYYAISPSGFEPDGGENHRGGKIPDYVTFCTDCHNEGYNSGMQSRQKRQVVAGGSTWIKNPDWRTSPHGLADGANNDGTNRKDPYKAPGNYVLSCTDCHEPHGSPNHMLIRETVNGRSLVDFTAWNGREEWRSLCERCHDLSITHQSDGGPCSGCHVHDPNGPKPL